MSYTSSIVNKYGDSSRVREDSNLLRAVFARQGTSFFLDAIAGYSGDAANLLNLSDSDRQTLVAGIVEELRNSLNERV